MNNPAVIHNLTSESIRLRPATPKPAVGDKPAMPQYECFIGISSHVESLKQFVSVQSAQQHPVLLTGERGLRQEQIARALHQCSKLWDAPFVAVNVHSLSTEALNELLFGPQGLMSTCRRGVLYVNELASLPLLLQQRFAVHFEEMQWRRSADQTERPRLIMSTEFKPSQLSAENRIAYGLIEMLRPWSFAIKPLRERSEDIQYLAAHLIERIASRLQRGTHQITESAMQMLTEYAWEANIDELEAVLESAISRTAPQTIDIELLPTRVRHAGLRLLPAEGVDLSNIVDDFELTLIETALRQTGGNQVKAAKLLGLRVQTLNMKLKRFGRQAKQQRP